MTYPSTIAKVALGLVGASTVAGAGFGIHSALQDKTIEHAIIRKGKKLINNKDVFEIAFKQHKEDTEFLKLISSEENKIQAGTSLENGGISLNAWCSTKLKLDLTEDNIQKVLPNAEKYCSLPPLMTMKQKLAKLGKQLAENWEVKLTSIPSSEDQELKNTLATNNSSISSVNSTKQNNAIIWKNALKSWCEEKADIPLTWDKNDDVFNKMNKYCFK